MIIPLSLKKPLVVAFFLGCTVSFLTARTLTLRLVAPALIYWAFAPLVVIASLAAVCWTDRKSVPFALLIDSFFAGYGPWLLWLVGLCGIWVLGSPVANSLDWTISIVWLVGGGAIATLWSLYLDFRFFRSVLRRKPANAVRQLAVQRLISWGPILTIVAGPTIWSEITGRLW